MYEGDRRAYPGLSGPCDVIACTTPMCNAGAANVNEMDSVYQNLSSDLQPQFQSSHDAIMSEFNSHWTTVDQLIPFNPVCCTICGEGEQAQALTAQMQKAAGAVGLAPGPTGSTPLPSAKDLLGFDPTALLWGAGALLAVIYVLPLISASRPRTSEA